MFTGIITHIGNVINIINYKPNKDNITFLWIEIPDKNFIEKKKIGDSISVNGVCLTIIEFLIFNKNIISFQVMNKTLERTNLSLLKINDYVNIEGAMNISNFTINGHIVTGHVDGTCKVTRILKNQDSSINIYVKINNVDNFQHNWIVYRGSIALSGISLTVAELYDDELMVSIIPYTYNHTILKHICVDDILNIEFDQQIKNNIIQIDNNNLIGNRIISHDHAMNLAIKVGELGRVTAPPNPWVGCIIVNNEIIIGVGYHIKAGQPHAEVNAINDAIKNGYSLNNSTMYVTLEPCSHYGKTPPCCNLLYDHQISNVYIALKDPDIRVRGNGIKYLEDKKINVVTNMVHDKAYLSLQPYLFNRRNNRPYIILKIASSLDGKIAASDKSSNWITCEESRKDVHKIRSESQAILIGINTCLNDNPKLNVRLDNYIHNHPIRIVLDTNGRLNNKNLNILNQEISKTIIFTSNNCNKETIKLWNSLSIQYYLVNVSSYSSNKLDLEKICVKLGELGIIQLIVEGGCEIFSNFIKCKLFNEIILYQGPLLIGSNGISFFETVIGDNINDKIILKLRDTYRVGLCTKNIYTPFENI